jgi:hypothetical protein
MNNGVGKIITLPRLPNAQAVPTNIARRLAKRLKMEPRLGEIDKFLKECREIISVSPLKKLEDEAWGDDVRWKRLCGVIVLAETVKQEGVYTRKGKVLKNRLKNELTEYRGKERWIKIEKRLILLKEEERDKKKIEDIEWIFSQVFDKSDFNLRREFQFHVRENGEVWIYPEPLRGSS